MKKSIISFSAMWVAAVAAAACMLPAAASDSRDGASIVTLQTPFSSDSLEFAQFREIIDGFEARNPGVRVELEADGPREHDGILRRILSRRPPDLLEIPLSELPELAVPVGVRDDGTQTGERMRKVKKMALAPVGDVFAGLRGSLFLSAIAAGQHEGVSYAIPFRASSTQLVYNPAVLTKAGYDARSPLLSSWNQLLITCAGIRRAMGGAYFPIGIDGAEGDSLARLAAMLVYQNHGRVIERKEADDGETEWTTPIDNEAGIKALDMMSKLAAFVPPEALGWSRGDLTNAFIDGRIALFYGDARAIGEIRSRAPALPIMAIQAPAHKASASYVDLYGVVMTPRGSEAGRKDVCDALLAYLCSQEAQAVVMKGGRSGTPVMAPVQRELLDDPWYEGHPEYRVFLEALWYPCPDVPNPGWAAVERRVLLPLLRRVMLLQTTPEAAARAAFMRGSQVLSTHYGYIGHISWTMRLGMGAVGVFLFLVIYFVIGHRPKHHAQ